GQPTVVGDWLFITNRGGKFYALDAKTGCVHWAVEDAASRTTPIVIRSSISPSGWATFVGVGKRVVRAFDAQTGKEIWHSESLENHMASNITGTPVVSGDEIFVPLSSGEEVVAMQPNYSCCTFRGSLAALDLKTGQKQWQTSMITEPLGPTRKNANGVLMQGPAGAPVWASPTVRSQASSTVSILTAGARFGKRRSVRAPRSAAWNGALAPTRSTSTFRTPTSAKSSMKSVWLQAHRPLSSIKYPASRAYPHSILSAAKLSGTPLLPSPLAIMRGTDRRT